MTACHQPYQSMGGESFTPLPELRRRPVAASALRTLARRGASGGTGLRRRQSPSLLPPYPSLVVEAATAAPSGLVSWAGAPRGAVGCCGASGGPSGGGERLGAVRVKGTGTRRVGEAMLLGCKQERAVFADTCEGVVVANVSHG